jgi:hypothetical protein
MRRFFLSAALAAITAVTPNWVLADDAATAQQVAEALRASGQLKDYSIGVKFEEGRAFLMGRVASKQQAETAVGLAKQLSYVTEVENHLEIKASPKQDFAVAPTAHADGPVMNRDDALFGSAPQVPSPVVLQSAALPTPAPQLAPSRAPGVIPHNVQSAQPAQRVMNNANTMKRQQSGTPIPTAVAPSGVAQRVAYDQPHLPCYSWPSYASHPNYAAVQYPNQHSAAAWPYIGPFYPYPQVPLGWRKVTLEWKDGWWFLDFNDHCRTFRR